MHFEILVMETFSIRVSQILDEENYLKLSHNAVWISKTPVARCPLRVASWHKNARCWQKNTRWCPKNARWHNNACCSENMLTWFHPLPTQKHPLNCALSMECKNALRKIFTYLVLGRDEIRGWHPRNYTKMSSHILNTITLIRADYRL